MSVLNPDGRPEMSLLRLAVARLGISAMGVYILEDDGARLWTSTADFSLNQSRFSRNDHQGWTELPKPLRHALATTGASRLTTVQTGIHCEFITLMPIWRNNAPIGFILMIDPRRRWLGPRAAQGMQDTAQLFASLIAHARPDSVAPKEARDDSTVAIPDDTLRNSVTRMVQFAHLDAMEIINSSILLIDIDRFHEINEALGAAAGDTLLAATGSRLRDILGPGDRMIRLESDRFLVITPRPAPELPDFAGMLIDCVSEAHSIDGRDVSLQATMSLVPALDGDNTAASMFLHAELALRRGKREGGNRIVMHDPRLDAALQDNSRLKLDLAEAMENDGLQIVYQPYFDLAGDSVSGYEALMRWTHPERGNMQPSQFIGLAEASGLILPLGAWSLNRALSDAAGWDGDFRLSVNISALQFHQPEFVDQVDAALARSGFPAERLELELTETVLLNEEPGTVRRIKSLIDRGIQIALDDFGTGYSALSYLSRIPHHRIKLDRSFVQDLENPATAELIRAIIQSARAQGIKVTAEGIETDKQLRQVREFGFTHAQGFLIGRPVDQPMEVADTGGPSAISV